MRPAPEARRQKLDWLGERNYRIITVKAGDDVTADVNGVMEHILSVIPGGAEARSRSDGNKSIPLQSELLHRRRDFVSGLIDDLAKLHRGR